MREHPPDEARSDSIAKGRVVLVLAFTAGYIDASHYLG